MLSILPSGFDPWNEPVLIALGVWFAGLVWIASVKFRVERRDAAVRTRWSNFVD